MDFDSFGVMLSEPDTILVAERLDVSDWGSATRPHHRLASTFGSNPKLSL